MAWLGCDNLRALVDVGLAAAEGSAMIALRLSAILLGFGLMGACTKAPTKPLVEPAQILLQSNRGSGEAPDKFTVKLQTTQGDIFIDVTRAWAPGGADRFYHLVKIGFYTDNAFYRVIPGFMAQAGLHGHPKVAAAWRRAKLGDDDVKQSNGLGYVAFASSGAHSRTTQFFINLADNKKLDGQTFAPFGKVRDMTVVNKLYGEYGEGRPQGSGPSQIRLKKLGNPYLESNFPKLDYIRSASIEEL